MIFEIESAKNGENDFDFESKHEEFKEVSDEVMKMKIKQDFKSMIQRKKNGVEIDVYVYKYIDGAESAVWIHNCTKEKY